MARGKLTPLQARFVQEYLVDLNAAGALRRAGSKSRNPNVDAQKFLANSNIAEAIQSGKSKRSKRLEISADRVLQEIAKRAFARYSDYIRIDGDGQPVIDLSVCTPEQLDALTETYTETVAERDGEGWTRVRKTKIKVGDQGKYLELLMKHLGMLTDKVDVRVNTMTDEEIANELAAIAARSAHHRGS